MNDDDFRQSNIILFDGVCNLCNTSVIFILQREQTRTFQFASIQSEAGRELLVLCGLPRDFEQAIVFVERGKVALGSTAALKIGRYLKFPWPFLSGIGLLVPEFIRDRVYSQIASHRYRWFGKREVCMVPTDDLRDRFL